MDKKIVITGASKGIGKAIAIRFAMEGYRVAVCSRDENNLKALADEIQKMGANHPLLYVVCNAAKKDDIQRFYETVKANFGAVDILVNNAGIFVPGQIMNEEEGVFEEIMNVNIGSAYHFTRLFAKDMVEKQSGHIFSMCSVASIKAYPNGGSYCISKFALMGLTKVLREEMKPHNVKVTAIIPGATYTESWSGAGLPEDRFIPAEDVADTIFHISQLSHRTNVEEILMRPQLGDI